MKYQIGVVAGNFDVVHIGYVRLFKEMNKYCEKQFILIHEDPTKERVNKIKPIFNVEERKEILKHFLNDPVFLCYNTEKELLFLLKSINPDVRFLGDDYVGKKYTGDYLGILIHWIDRKHEWSTTKYKTLIAESLVKKFKRNEIRKYRRKNHFRNYTRTR